MKNFIICCIIGFFLVWNTGHFVHAIFTDRDLIVTLFYFLATAAYVDLANNYFIRKNEWLDTWSVERN